MLFDDIAKANIEALKNRDKVARSRVLNNFKIQNL